MSDLRLTAVKYGETALPLFMAFADAAGERDRKVPISLVVYLVEAEGRRILVDAGCDTMPGFTLTCHISPAEALRRLGVDPLSVTDLVLTHAHHDHAEAAHHFQNATVYIHASEREKAEAKGFLAAAPRVVTFDGEIAVGPLRVLCWGGHAAGSAIACLAHGGREYVMCGDECYLRACLAEKRPTGVSKNPEKSRLFVERFSDPAYTVLPAHDETLLMGKIGAIRII